MSNLLEIRGLTRSYTLPAGTLRVLTEVNFALKKGEMVALVGPSGSGKSTFMQLVGLLDTPNAGSISLNGESLEKANDARRTAIRNSALGFVYQFHHLLPEFTATENVMMPALLAGKSRHVAQETAETLLTEMELAARMQHMPTELYGGEQQRVAIARAIMNKPALQLADEPTGNLDSENAARILDVLLAQRNKHGMSAIIATHNLELARKLDRAVTIRHEKIEEIRP